MLPKERVIAAFEHREPDMIPWGEHFIDHNVFEAILGRPTLLHAKFRETQALWEGRRDEVVAHHKRDWPELIRALGMDIVPVQKMPASDYRPEPMRRLDEGVYQDSDGSIFHVSETTGQLMPYRRVPPADYVEPTIASVEAEIAAIDDEPLGSPDDSEYELARHIVKEMGDTHFIIMLMGDVAWPSFGLTEEERWMNIALQPELCGLIGLRNGKRLVREIGIYAQLGVDAIMPAGDLGSSTSLLASPRFWRKYVYGVNKAMIDEAHRLGLKVAKHCCGHTWPVIDDLADLYDGYEGIQASGGMDIKRLKGRVGERLCLWGGIWHEHIIMGDLEDIRADARYAFEHAAPGGGYIMGSSHSLAVSARIENILEMQRCRDEWGCYPITPRRWY